MADVLQFLHAAGDAIGLLLAAILAWAAFVVVGPLLCAGVVLLRAAGAALPADTPFLFIGTGAAWTLAFAGVVASRLVRAAWLSVMRAARPRPRQRARRPDDPHRAHPGSGWAWSATAGPTGPFAFSFQDPRVAWAAAQLRAARARQRTAGSSHARGARTRGDSASARAGDERRHAPPPPREPPRPREPPAPDPHDVLGVRKGASKDDVRKAYRDLVKKYHPDRVGDLPPEFRNVAHQKTMEIRRAYEALSEASPGRR